MTKIKLKITHIIDSKKIISYATGVREDDKIFYLNDNSKVIVLKKEHNLIIRRINEVENNMIFGNGSFGYFMIDNKKVEYQIITNKLLITKSKIEIDYIIESKNKYILEVLDD